jgi:ceramide glucosyltransferase
MFAVSVLKPLKGIDDELAENLTSFFLLDYPNFELIFGIEDPNDPAIAVVRRLQDKFPDTPTKLVIGSARVGVNPKINNLHNMEEHARFDVLVVSDSNVRVQPDYLSDLVERLHEPGIGLVTSAIRGVGSSSAGSILENLQMNSFVASGVVAVNRFLGIPITIGKSMCIRRITLNDLGGFRAFADYLAEDFLLGRSVRHAGLKVVISPRTIDSVCRSWSLSHFANRHLRWMTMRKHINLLHYLLEIIANPVLLALLHLAITRDPASLVLFAGVCAAKVLVDTAALRIMRAPIRIAHIALIPVKDLAMGLIWVAPFFIRRINWRGNRMIVGRNTALVACGVRPAQELTVGTRRVLGLPYRVGTALISSIRAAGLS